MSLSTPVFVFSWEVHYILPSPCAYEYILERLPKPAQNGFSQISTLCTINLPCNHLWSSFSFLESVMFLLFAFERHWENTFAASIVLTISPPIIHFLHLLSDFPIIIPTPPVMVPMLTDRQFPATQETTNWAKHNPTGWERIFGIYTSNWGLFSKIYTEFKKQIFKETKDTIKMR